MSHRTVLLLLVALFCSQALGPTWTRGRLNAQQATPPAPNAAPAQGPTEAPPVVFRVEVDYVEVDALVTDAQGVPAVGLTVDDFELLEDGKPQKISSLAMVNLPIERAPRPLFADQPVEVDVQTNTQSEGRIYLLVLDDLHTDFTRTPRVQAAARRFIEQNFGVNDLAAVVFTGRGEDAQDFTNNPRLLLRAIAKFNGRKLQSATINRLENVRTDPSTGGLAPGDDTDQQERAYRARTAMSTIRRLAEFMAGVRGRRKAMLLVGEGVDYNIYEAVGVLGSTASSVILDTHDAIAAATRGNVSIYALDPRGLQTGAEDLITQSSTMPEQGAGLNSLQSELRLSQDSLRVLAANTGGFAAVNRNDLNDAFDRIVRENSSYYLLGFYSSNDRRSGRHRKLEVRVKRPGLRVVRARTGYFEARGRKPDTPTPSPSALAPAVAASLGSPLPVAGVPLKVFAAPFKGTSPNAAIAVALELDANALEFVEKNGAFVEQLDVAHSATDARGKVFPGERHGLNLALKPDTFERVKSGGFRVVTQINLPPGRYQLRLAAGNKTGKAGSVIYDLDVPDFAKLPFSMSGVALTSMTAAAQGATLKAKDPLGDFLPGPPVATREFQTSDTVAFFAEIYENARGGAAHQVDLVAELRAEGGRVVREAREERSSNEVRGGGGYGFSARFPLEGLTPGLYVLHISGQSRQGDRAQVSRDILLTLK